jgi:Na+-translocating ferredoxin:NAD+ oxidoreductase RNF subunit RnfB
MLEKANALTSSTEKSPEKIKENASKIVVLLPKENCGKCGFPNCGGFALAVASGEASPHGCRKIPGTANSICEALGIDVPEDKDADVHHRGHHGHHAGIQHGCIKHGDHGHHHGHGENHHHSKD